MDVLNVGPFSDISVLAVRADEEACGHYRIEYPMTFLERGGAKVGVEKYFHPSLVKDFDIIIAQRQYVDRSYDDLRQVKQLYHKTLIYEVDDNLHAVHPYSQAYSVYRPGSETLRNVDKIMSICDGFFTTTPELASQYRSKCVRTWVLPNQIDFGIRNWDGPFEKDPLLVAKINEVREKCGREPVVVGWAGSITHQDDWNAMPPIGEIMRKHPHVIFCMVSAYRIMEMFTTFLKADPERTVCLGPTTFTEFPPVLHNFDIGICAVVNTEFNRAKSDLKILEYGAHSIPYVATNIAPYTRFHLETQGQGGILMGHPKNDGDFEKLVTDDDYRKKKSQFIGNYVRTERSMANNVWRWAEALREAKAATAMGSDIKRQYYVKEKPERNDKCPCNSVDNKKYKSCCSPAWG